MKNNCESLKLLARRAKNRLKGDVSQMVKNFAFEAENNIETLEDNNLAQRIYTLLRNKKETLTPIGELIDYQKFNLLSALQREIYIFDLIEKYNYYKGVFEKEKRNTEQRDLVV